MGVVNVTPDSFSDGGMFLDPEQAAARAWALARAGADVIDIGGESTRPGATPVSASDELGRVLPVLARLAGLLPIPISIDTTKAEVADRALRAGAAVVNDVSGGRLDPEILAGAAQRGAACILGHLRGTPRTMQERIDYRDVVREVGAELAERVAAAERAGIREILVDPGLGFGKTFEHNLELIRRLSEIRRAAGRPLVVGPSRKSFIGRIVDGASADAASAERLLGTCAAAVACVLAGADVVRLHDVGELTPAVRVADAIARPT
jgi:dihydropteroate synthase